MRILLATDGSPCSDRALDLVASTDWPDDTTIRVIAALEHAPALFGVPWMAVMPVDSGEVEAAMQADMSGVLERAQARLAAPGRTIDAALLRGRPASEILEDARHFAPDLIVVGSRGHGQLESMLLGSTSAEVVDHAPCPVLVARSEAVHRIVVAEDGSEGAKEAIDLLCHWSIWPGRPVTVLSVSDVPIPIDSGVAPGTYGAVLEAYGQACQESTRQHELLARGTADRLADAGLAAVPDVRDGDAAGQIIRVATEQRADLIVIGTRGRSALSRILLGSVARNVLLHAHCSVLIARAHHHAPQPATDGTLASTSA